MDTTLLPSTPRQPGLVGGLDWQSNPPYQEIVPLSFEDARALNFGNRLARIKTAGGARPLLLDLTPRVSTAGGNGNASARLLLTGKVEAVEKTKQAVRQLLAKESGVSVAVRPEDTRHLQKPSRGLLHHLEAMSGCRVVVDRQQGRGKDPIEQRKLHLVTLLGDDDAKAKAQRLLAAHCGRLAPAEIPQRFATGFDRELLGRGARVSGAQGTVAGRLGDVEKDPKGCIVAGNGPCRVYFLGAFYCLTVNRVDGNPRLRGGTRLGVMSQAMTAPVPETLLMRPRRSWVVGGGRCRGDKQVAALPAASFDAVEAGDQVGLMVTKQGSIAVFRRAALDFEWACLLHWDAQVEDYSSCYPVLELAGRLVEVELLQTAPPNELERPFDTVAEPPRIWPRPCDRL